MAKTGFWLRGGSAGISTLNNQYLNNAGQGSVLQSGSGTAGLVIPKTAVHLPQKAQKTQKFNPHTEAQSILFQPFLRDNTKTNENKSRIILHFAHLFVTSQAKTIIYNYY